MDDFNCLLQDEAGSAVPIDLSIDRQPFSFPLFSKESNKYPKKVIFSFFGRWGLVCGRGGGGFLALRYMIDPCHSGLKLVLLSNHHIFNTTHRKTPPFGDQNPFGSK